MFRPVACKGDGVGPRSDSRAGCTGASVNRLRRRFSVAEPVWNSVLAGRRSLRMTIAKRLTFLLAVPLMALVALGVFTRVELSKIEARSRFEAEKQVPGLAALGNTSRSYAELRVNLRSFLL